MRALLLAPLTLALSAQPSAETITTLRDQKKLSVTVYNQDLALIKDQRELRLPLGDLRMAFQDVSARMRPETALLRSLTEPKGFWIHEQNFDFDLLTPQKLLEKYVGEKITVISHKNGQDVSEEATVLATNEGTVLQYGDRVETNLYGRMIFPKVPGNLRARPTLVMSLHNPTERSQRLELSYLTGGLSWKADYVASLAPDEKTLDLNGWVTLTNQSGAAYPNATLQLVAGDVNRVAESEAKELLETAMLDGSFKQEKPKMKEEGLFEYHLYTLDRPTTLKENQTKQVALLSASQVPVRKEYLLQGQNHYYRGSYGDLGDKLKVGVYVEFDNRTENRMGMPLPKGVVRVYKQDTEGRAQFVGEDAMDHTPTNELVRLKLGDAFDVTARRKQTDYKILGKQGRWHDVVETAFRVELKNAKKETVTVSVLEPIWGDWEIIEKSHAFTKEAAGAARFKVTVPAEGSATLTYRVRTKW